LKCSPEIFPFLLSPFGKRRDARLGLCHTGQVHEYGLPHLLVLLRRPPEMSWQESPAHPVARRVDCTTRNGSASQNGRELPRPVSRIHNPTFNAYFFRAAIQIAGR
jgi:hypothetical protein